MVCTLSYDIIRRNVGEVLFSLSFLPMLHISNSSKSMSILIVVSHIFVVITPFIMGMDMFLLEEYGKFTVKVREFPH